MSRSYVETFFRHKTLCVAPVLVAAALGGALALNRPAQYVASASIFADAPLPAPSTVGTTGGNAPPAAGQQALMNNFLATRSFLLSVGKSAQLPGFGADEPAPVLAKSLAALRRDVATAIPGPNVMVVTVTRPDAAGATRVAGAVVDQFLSLERNTIGHRAQSQLADAKAQLQPAAKAVTDAQTALTTYLRAHPGSSAAGDPQLALLRTALTHADDAYQATQTSLGDIVAQVPVVDASSLFVIDHPDAASSKGHKKALVFGAGGGLLAGLALSVMLLMGLVSRDNVVRSVGDVEQGLGLPVVATIRQFRRDERRKSRTKQPVMVSAYAGPPDEAAAGDTTAAGPPSAPPEWVPEHVVAACRSALRRLDDSQGPLAVTASSAGQGSTTVVLGLALARREDLDRRTVLLDLNFWQPGLGTALGLAPAPGLAEVLRGEVAGDAALQWPDPHVGVVTAGNVDDPMRLLATFRRSSVISDLVARGYDVIADLPPLPPAGRGDRVADMFWNVLVVVRSGAATMPAVRNATTFLTTTTSVVLNGEASPLPRWLHHDRAG